MAQLTPLQMAQPHPTTNFSTNKTKLYKMEANYIVHFNHRLTVRL